MEKEKLCYVAPAVKDWDVRTAHSLCLSVEAYGDGGWSWNSDEEEESER